MGNRDQDYYRRRIEQESAAAQRASSACARDVHLDLVSLYSEKLRLIQALDSDATFAEPLHPALVRRTA